MAVKSKKPVKGATKPKTRRPADEEEDLLEDEGGFGEEEETEEEEDEEVRTNNGTTAGGAKYWKNVFDNLGQGGNSSFIFPKNGKTQVRLIRKEGAPFYVEVPSFYRGKERTKYLLMAWNPNAKDDDGNTEYMIRGLVVPKTAFKAIAAHLAEDYDFFNPKSGHGLTLVRSGEGRDTAYTVIPSAKPVPLPQQLKGVLAKTSFKLLIAEYKKLRSSKPSEDGAEGGDEESSDDSDW